MTIALYALSIVLLLFFSAFFSGSEIAYSSANRMRLEASQEKAAKTALFIYDRFDQALSAILIGNNLVNISASSVATLLALELAGTSASTTRQDLFTTIGAILLTILVLIFGETMPKIVAKRDPQSFVLIVAKPLRFLMTILRPVTWVICGLVKLIISPLKGESLNEDEKAEAAEEELLDLIENGEDEGIIDEDQSELLQNALDFPDISAQEVMTPRVDMEALEIDDSAEEIRSRIAATKFSRLPVYDERRERIIGVLHLNHYYRAILNDPEVDIKSLLLEPCFVYKTMKLPAILTVLRQHKTHIAIVTDDYGSTIGIVTMEDVLEQIVGGVWNESGSPDERIAARGENTYEIDGSLTIGELCELLEWDEDEFDVDSVTVGGWTLELFEGFPKEGESIDYENVTVTVLKMAGLRVEKVLVAIHPKNEEED